MKESPWWRIGWRNLGRHPKRSLLTALGLGAGYFAVVFIVGWVKVVCSSEARGTDVADCLALPNSCSYP